MICKQEETHKVIPKKQIIKSSYQDVKQIINE